MSKTKSPAPLRANTAKQSPAGASASNSAQCTRLSFYTSPAFQFYPSDLLSDEDFISMSLPARGAFFTLLAHEWKQGSIPADSERIAKLCHSERAVIEELWPELSPVFIPHPAEPERLINRRLEEERAKQQERAVGRAASGKKGAKARWDAEKQGANGDAGVTANARQTHAVAKDLRTAKNGLSPSAPSSVPSSSSIKDEREEQMANAAASASSHPAIQAYRKIHNNHYPDEKYFQNIIDAVGENTELWEQALTEWKEEALRHNLDRKAGKLGAGAKRWNPRNVEPALEMFDNLLSEINFASGNNFTGAVSETTEGVTRLEVAGLSFYR